jgi:hypothetical protein
VPPQPTTIAPSPSRTYLILFEMQDEAAADQLVELLHGQPYTCLDENQKCSLHRVVAIRGDDGVSLLSPFFAPTVTTAAKATARDGSSAELATRSGSSDAPDGRIGTPKVAAPPSTAAGGAAARHRLQSATAADDSNCAVCLERLDWDHLGNAGGGEKSSILTTVCKYVLWCAPVVLRPFALPAILSSHFGLA